MMGEQSKTTTVLEEQQDDNEKLDFSIKTWARILFREKIPLQLSSSSSFSWWITGYTLEDFL